MYFEFDWFGSRFNTRFRAVCVLLVAFFTLFICGCQLSDPANNVEYKVTLSQSEAVTSVGEVIVLTAQSSSGSAVSWISSDEDVATVSSGVVMGVSEGSALITATDGRALATCRVTVTPAIAPPPTEGEKPPSSGDEMILVWSDEFDGDSLDMSKWSYMTGVQDVYGDSRGPKYWGNDELQYYTAGDNLTVSDGVMKITAKKEEKGDRSFTSSRISTRDNASWTYGYFEARIKAPAVEGMWPAFWMLPQPATTQSSHNAYGGWPASGEIDIMEAKGRLQNKVDCTLHFGNTWQSHDYTGKSATLDSNIDEWHTYALDWRVSYMAWIVDGVEVCRINSSRWWTSASEEEGAPFDKPFFILINLAVGGQYDGYREPPEDFVQDYMFVDYVRVYSGRQFYT